MMRQELHDLKILVVDDQPEIVKFMSTILLTYGFQRIEEMSDPRQVLKSVLVERPDIIILDLNMPEMSGFEVIAAVREALPPEEYLPILVVTSDNDDNAQRQAYQSGATDFLCKPIRHAELVLRVTNLLQARWQHLQLANRNQMLDREITVQRQLADSLAATTVRLSALISNLQSGVLVEDERQQIALVNEHFCQLFSISSIPPQLVGTSATQMAWKIKSAFRQPEQTMARMDEILSLRDPVYNEEIELADGRTFERDYVPIFREYKYAGHLWAYRDITERKRVERELAEARDTALQSARYKAEFLANMSHEIRTPINGVLGMLGLLADTPLTTDQHHLLNTAQSSADALLHIINDVLDFSKIEAGKLLIEDDVISPAALLDDCLLMVASMAQERGLELSSYISPEVPRGVRTDGARVRQILANFLSNAVKFTTHGEIIARIDVFGQDLRFSVTDTGFGIVPEDVARLFQPFTQVDGSSTRRHGGTGLGLAISRQIVELMGGKIGVDTTPDVGSVFWFTIPLTETEIDEGAASEDAVIALSNAHVLVVQANASVREILLKQLGSWQISCEGARNGQEGLERLRRALRVGRPYDAVLIDAQLPDMDAPRMAAEIKRLPKSDRTQLVLMTALHARSEDTSAFEAVLSKPVRQSQLHDALLTMFQGATPVQRVSSPQNSAPREDFSGVYVLVADDNPINREVALRWLRKWGCSVETVVDGKEALLAVQSNTYDLVLMDCQMPEMDGYEATRAIRALPLPVREIPIVAVTAHALEGDLQKCLDAGMNDYLAKPVKAISLAEILRRWVRPEGNTDSESADPEEQAPVEDVEALDREALTELCEVVGPDGMESLAELFYE